MEVPPKEKTANVEGGSMMGCALNDYLNLEENLHRNVQLLQRLLGVEGRGGEFTGSCQVLEV